MKPLFDTERPHATSLDEACPVADGSVVSKTLINTDAIKVIEFAMDAEQELSEHTTPFLATVHVIDGRLRFTVAQSEFDLGPNDWLLIPTDSPHALIAAEPTRFLLTLVKERAS